MSFLITTGDGFDGWTVVEYLGIVRGIAVRAPSLSRGIEAIGNALSGNIRKNVEVQEQISEETRADAFGKMVQRARELQADGILGMRYDTSHFGETLTEVLAYGTAVRLARLPRSTTDV